MARKKLQGQVAIITGGSRGLGLATAEQLVQAGATIVLTARSEDQVTAAATDLSKNGARVLGIAADVADLEHVERVVDTTLAQFGRIDILVNNAATVWPIDEVAETDPDEWAYNIHVNLVGPFYMAHHVLPAMLEQKQGRIVNVSSGLGHIPIAGLSAYGAAKAGLDQLTRVLALELMNSGVTVNALYPGILNTDMQADLRSVDTSESVLDLKMFHEAYETGKIALPATAARMIYWLVGPWSRQHNGEIFTSRDQAWLEQVKRDLNG
jgi:NAD(P)-dependent dehydrogenase (short-subunit alcohol dehydrogenase family)